MFRGYSVFQISVVAKKILKPPKTPCIPQLHMPAAAGETPSVSRINITSALSDAYIATFYLQLYR